VELLSFTRVYIPSILLHRYIIIASDLEYNSFDVYFGKITISLQVGENPVSPPKSQVKFFQLLEK